MGITTEQYEKIIRFLDAGMGPAEMDAFEKEMAANPEMRDQLDFEQSIRDEFSSSNITSLPGNALAINSVPARVMPGKIKRMRKWLSAGAAAIIALILVAVFWQKTGKAPDIARKMDTLLPSAGQSGTKMPPVQHGSQAIDLSLLFRQYFKKDALPEQYPVFLAQALTDYESGNYTTLQQLNLDDLPQTRGIGGSDTKEKILKWGHYYKGIAYLQNNRTHEAIENLEWLLNNHPGKALKAKTQWYLALAYLKENDGKKAAGFCRSIIDDNENPRLAKNAEKILNALNK